jgi:phage terminase large subunit
MRAKGFRTRVLPQVEVADGINAARTIFPQCWFDATKCKDGLMALRRYQWGAPGAQGAAKRKPQHDNASHGADAFRCLAMSIKTPSANPQKRNIRNLFGRGMDSGNNGQRWMG